MTEWSVFRAVGEAEHVVEVLADEMCGWSESIGERFSATGKYSVIYDSMERLEAGITDKRMPDHLRDLKVQVHVVVGAKRMSRGRRLAVVIKILKAVRQAILDYGELPEDEPEDPRDRSERERYMEGIEEAIQRLEGVRFVRAYGN